MAEKDYIDENDPALKAVEADKNTALTNSNKIYDDAISANDKAIDSLITQNQTAAAEAERLQKEQTQFTIDKIEQEKAQAKKDYTKEQSASYVDWQKQSGKYGANAEAMADRGLSNTGYSESAQVSMYNTYQNRVAVARETFKKAELEFANGIREAKLAGSSAIAKIKAETFAKQMELTLQGLQYKNEMLAQKAQAALSVEQLYQNKYMDVYDQLYKEAALAEEARQFDATLAEQKRQFDKEYDATYGDGSLTINGGSSGGGGGGGGSISGPVSNEYVADQIRKDNPSISGSVNTDFYQGAKNPDAAKYDTFSNGYQPKGISGHGKLSKTGDTYTFSTKTLKGKTVTVTQNIWQAEDGTTWYWDGTKNKYIRFKGDPGQKYSSGYAVKTKNYTGTLNPDAKYGTFSNGYQPDNIGGKKLEKTRGTVTVNGQKQTIWATPDGKRWKWDGKKNKYVPVGA